MTQYSITLIDENNPLTFEEICRAIHAEDELVIQLIEYQIIHPVGTGKHNWRFDHLSLKRARLARNLYYDCEVNIAGVGLLIDLLERIEQLENTINRHK
jgi:chaperone modulatory protein CbpM